MTDQLPLTGKRALIMGVPADIAEPIALALAAAGADVALTTATNDAEEAFSLRRITRGVKALGRASLNESVDMANGTGVQMAVRQVAKALGGLDIVIAGASAEIDKPSERLTDADWARVLNGNLSAIFFACRSAVRELRGNDPAGGHIVVLLPPVPAAAPAPVAAAIAGVEALTAGLKEEWAPQGVTVSTLSSAEDPTAAVLAAITPNS